MRAFASLLVVVMCWIASNAIARADVPAPPAGTPSADDMKEARRHFSVGNDLYKDGRYKEALLEFDAAYRSSGRPAALLNVGDCQRQLNAADGSSIPTLLGEGAPNGTGGYAGIVVDAVRGKVYWANTASGQIVSCPIGGCPGKNPTPLAPVRTIGNVGADIAIDDSCVYWTDQAAGTVSRIAKPM